MNMLSQFNEAMAYIERNLMCDIELNQISRIACCSEYHFRRMFSFLAGMPLGEYIRRRRLSVAGILLQTEPVKVIDLALQLGYESPEAFSKAFQTMHGVTPSQAKKENTGLKILPPMTFQLTIRGGIEMNYRIAEKNEFYIVGFKKRITMQFKGINPQMDSLIQKLTPQIIAELKGLCDVEPKGILNVSANFQERIIEGSELDQYIGVATSKTVSNDYDILHVAASTWAVFKVIGTFPDAIQDTWAKIYAEWFPASGYELTGGLSYCGMKVLTRADQIIRVRYGFLFAKLRVKSTIDIKLLDAYKKAVIGQSICCAYRRKTYNQAAAWNWRFSMYPKQLFLVRRGRSFTVAAGCSQSFVPI